MKNMYSYYILIKLPIGWADTRERLKEYICENFTFDRLEIIHEERCTIYIEADSSEVETLLEKFSRGL
jgi:hypothetical protein